MKRVIIILLTFVMILCTSVCFAQDLSSLSFEDLQTKVDSYNLLLWKAGNWSSIVVPDGDYVIGEDIPDGIYQVEPCTSKMSTWITLFPSGLDDERDPRYIDNTFSDHFSLELQSGDILRIQWAGLKFNISEYMPRFEIDPVQEAAVLQLKNEHSQVEAELRTRDEWKEVRVPKGVYEVGPKIPVGKWTIWPEKSSRAGFYYGQGLTSEGSVFYVNIRAALKSTDLRFEYGYHEDRVSVDAEEGFYIEVTDTVIFTPYAGHPLFQFND